MNRDLKLGVYFLLLLSISCKREVVLTPLPPAEESTPGFLIEEVLYGYVTHYPVDTIWGPATIRFTADERYKQCSWKVGNDVRTWNTSSFELDFTEPMDKILVTLIGKRLVDSYDTSLYTTDTIVRRFWSLPADSLKTILGVYVGQVGGNNTNDTLRVYKYDGGIAISSFSICSRKYSYPVFLSSISANQLMVKDNYLCMFRKAYGYLDKENKRKITLNFEYDEEKSTQPGSYYTVKGTFTGFKN